MKRYLTISLIIFILGLGLFLRVHKLSEWTSFDADQEWLMKRSGELLKGDLPLLGPVTSVGNFSIGPGYVYLTAVFSFILGGDPIAGSFLSVFLGILTLILIYVFSFYFLDKKVAMLLLFITSISFNLAIWDINPWAPSLFNIAQIVLLAGAYLSMKKDIGYPVLAAGVVLGFQSHFGIVLSLLSVIIFYIFNKPIKPSRKIFLITLLILFFGFLPNLVHDIRNDFINSKRLVSTVKGDGLDYFVGFGKIVDTVSSNISGIIYPRRINPLDTIISRAFLALLIVSTLSFVRNKKYKHLASLLLISVTIPSAFFYIQQGKFSEYYLMMTVVPLILMLGLFLKQIEKQKLLITLILLASIYVNIKSFINYERKMGLGAKKEVLENIIKMGGKENYGISLTTRHGDQFGFDYLINYYGIKADVPPKKGETKIFTIVVPEGFDGVTGMKDYDGIGLIWQGI